MSFKKFILDLYHDERAFVIPLLTAAFQGGKALGGLFNKRKGGSSGGGAASAPAQSAANDPVIKDLLAGQSQIRDFTIGQATKSLRRAEAAADPVQDFLSRLLSGDKATTAQAIGPQANTVLEQYESARQTALQGAPRGGGRGQTLAQIPFQKAGAISSLIQKTIPTATEGLTRLAGIEGGIGTSLAATGAQVGAQSLQALLTSRASAESIALAERKRKDINKKALAGGIGKILAFTFGKGGPLRGLVTKKKGGG